MLTLHKGIYIVHTERELFWNFSLCNVGFVTIFRRGERGGVPCGSTSTGLGEVHTCGGIVRARAPLNMKPWSVYNQLCLSHLSSSVGRALSLECPTETAFPQVR